MSFIQFESAREKEKIRQELREAREQMLQKAQKGAEERAQRELQRELRGESNWMLPAVAAKIDKLNEASTSKSSSKKKKKEKTKKAKKSKKSKKSGKKRKRASSSSEFSDSESDERRKSRKKKKHTKQREQDDSSSDDDDNVKKSRKRGKGEYSSSGSSSESENENDEWVERSSNKPDGGNSGQTALQREDWMTQAFTLKTFSRDRPEKKPQEKQQIDAYDPAKSTRELNPYWKMTGTGLPAFRKPKEDEDEDAPQTNRQQSRTSSSGNSKNWQKPTAERRDINNRERNDTSSSSSSEEEDNESNANTESEPAAAPATPAAGRFLTDQQMNELGAKIVKAEIMGNTDLAAELKQRLEEARVNRAEFKDRKTQEKRGETRSSSTQAEEHILLTRTDQKGNARPLLQKPNESDLWGGRQGKKKQKRTETHVDGERVRYFPDDDKYDIKRMFEREKYTSAAESNLEFANIAAKHKNPNDDLEDIFADKIRRNVSNEQTGRQEVQRAIHEQQRLDAQLQNCTSCFDSARMDKSLLVSLGDKIHLTLPWHVGLQPGHCILAPTQHVSCCTQLDEDSWEELNDFRKALTRLYAAQGKDVIFFEIANKLHRRPHLNIHCVPIRGSHAEMAPFYFKKAIEESEREWSTNKQLVRLREKGLRSSIPKGLPYFWVHFGMQSGFAHVIEDEDRFPANFAQEIIGGLLELDPRAWRRPQKESNVVAKVKKFADEWKKYDCTQ